jgi:hypothetical protein
MDMWLAVTAVEARSLAYNEQKHRADLRGMSVAVLIITSTCCNLRSVVKRCTRHYHMHSSCASSPAG